MISPRWRKSLSDLLAYKSRSLLVIVAIAIGLWGISSIAITRYILNKDIAANFSATHPATATLVTKQALNDSIVAALERQSWIARAELRTTVRARVLIGKDTWQTLRLFVVRDFDRLRINTFALEEGRKPGKGEIIIERDAWVLFERDGIDPKRFKINGDVTMRVPGSGRHRLRISGRAHDPGLPPSRMDHVIYGYIGMDTYRMLRPGGSFNELRIVAAINVPDRAGARAVAGKVRAWLLNHGIETVRMDVPIPGRHPHQGQLDSLLLLQGAFGVLAFVLCSILIVNIMAFLLARQVRQIGIMKAIGATPIQVGTMYYLVVVVLAALGALIGIPLGLASGSSYAVFAASELNLNILTTSLPVGFYLFMFGVAILMPVVVASPPILKGSRVTVLRALSDHGLGSEGGSRASSGHSRLLSGLPRPVLLSIYSTLRRRGRTIFTVAALAVGLMIFISALNLRASLAQTLQETGQAQHFDLSVSLVRAVPVERVRKALAGVKGIAETGYWQGGYGAIIYTDSTASNRYIIASPPVPPRLFEPIMLEGAWLKPESGNTIVINQQLQFEEQRLTTGAMVNVRIGTRVEFFRVVGVTREMALPALYMSPPNYRRLSGEGETTGSLRIVATDKGLQAVRELNQRVERALETAGIDVSSSLRKTEYLKIIDDHLDILTNMLLVSSIMALLVAGLGLVSTMGINLMERTREIGVMRAIGATSGMLYLMVFVETLLVGFLSWLGAIALAIPFSGWLSAFFGDLIIETPMPLVISPWALPASLVLMVLFVLTASFAARRAMDRMTLHEALAYE